LIFSRKDSGQAGLTNERKMKIKSKLNKNYRKEN